MKLDPGMHIGLQLVFFGKTGVTGVKLSTSVPAWLRETQKSGVSKRVRRNKVKTN
jgi:hypothetical protein